MMKPTIIILLVLGAIILNAKPPGEEENIISVVQQFFDVMESPNREKAQKILIPEGFSFSLRKEGKEETIKISSFREFLHTLSTLKDQYKEVMSNPKVLIHNGIAVLWTDYKFYINGKFSHCGVDAFSLIKTPDGWKIAGIVYTVEKTGCEQKETEKRR